MPLFKTQDTSQPKQALARRAAGVSQSQGFDAPRTRAIIVARPVYSPNLYFQMIGRGLRGPQNGGSDRCLILNVDDNIENFDKALAFNGLEWLWA